MSIFSRPDDIQISYSAASATSCRLSGCREEVVLRTFRPDNLFNVLHDKSNFFAYNRSHFPSFSLCKRCCLPLLLEGSNAVQHFASGEQSGDDPPAAVCSVVPSASSLLSAGCILFSGSGGANPRLFTPTQGPSLISCVFIPQGGNRQRGGGGLVISAGCPLPLRNLESALRRLEANWDGFVPDLCSAPPTPLSPATPPSLYCCL